MSSLEVKNRKSHPHPDNDNRDEAATQLRLVENGWQPSLREGWLHRDFFEFSLDKIKGNWFNDSVMRQMNRKNNGNWWWPAG